MILAVVFVLAFAAHGAPSFASTPLHAPRAQDGKTFDELERDVADADARKRRVAVRRLSELDTEAAWKLVVERLADGDPQVADEAQLRLADLAHDEFWEELALGKQGLGSKEVLIRRRVVEALGRSGTALAEGALERALSDREADVRRLAAWSLERRFASAAGASIAAEARERVCDALAKVLRVDKDGAVKGAALLALQAAGAAEPSYAVQALGLAEKCITSRDAAERVGAVIALGREGSDAAVALVRARAADPALAVRIEVVRSLAAARTRAGAVALVELLENEPEAMLAIRIAEALQRLSGLRHRTDPRPWRDWVDRLAADWTPTASAEPEEFTVTKLVGLPIRSERLTVLIDMSGSMWQTREDGNKTKDLVDVEVRRCLEGLPKTARFNLIPYATKPGPYEDELVEASPKKVAKALEWFVENDLRGQGNVWDAIEVALADGAVDTFVIMTDGAPSGGPHWNLELMVPLLLERNRFRNIVFDVVLSESRGNLLPHWQRLASESGGRCVEVTFGS